MPDPGDDPHRPLLHFTARRHWINDPNGLVHHDGVWHLYFQHNPEGTSWGNMSWGHATSPDLLRWEEQPLALRHTPVEHVFSGSVVLDADNTSGLGTAADPPLVAVYTSAWTPAHRTHAGHQSQSIAWSADGGRTWTPYADNPVLDRASADFRDPKVFRYDGPAGDYWVMVAVEAVHQQVVLHRSDDLLTWEHLSSFDNPHRAEVVWECPDLFSLPLDGASGGERWVLVVSLNPGAVAGGSGAEYFVGDFDGTTFTTEDSTGPGLGGHDWLDWGRDHYAAVSFSGVAEGRRVMIGWMSNWDYAEQLPTGGWRGAMTLPREVELVPTPRGPRLRQRVVDEIEGLRDHAAALTLGLRTLPEGPTALPVRGDAVQVDAVIRPGAAEAAGISVLGDDEHATTIGYDVAAGQLVVDRRHSGDVGFSDAFASVERVPVPLVGGALAIRVYVDRSSVEVFTDGGLVSVTDLVFPAPGADRIGAWARGGTAVLESLVVTPLHPAGWR